MKQGHLGWLFRRMLLPVLWVFACYGQSPKVLQVDVEHVVHPLTVEIVSQATAQAEADGAAAVLIRLNTPGGLLSATQQVIQAIVASKVPVITYVAPSGGRAASAGFMILIAGDVAAMAPGTNSGAAHPVLMAGEMDDVMKQKVENDAAASVRAMADKRGRNPELAEKAVRESKAFTEREALDSKLIDLIADDPAALIAQLDGRTIKRFDGSEETLSLAGAAITIFELSYRQTILLSLINPNLAFVLLILGLVGIYVEFTHPGLIIPGVAGADSGDCRRHGAHSVAHQLGGGGADRAGARLLHSRGHPRIGGLACRGRSNRDDPGCRHAGRHRSSGTLDRLADGHRSDIAVRSDHGILAAACGQVVSV